jgi:hypothetical protein
MKKVLLFVLLLVGVCGFASCSTAPIISGSSEAVSTVPNSDAVEDTTFNSGILDENPIVVQPSKSLPPFYVPPESVELDPGEEYCDEDAAYFKRHYRMIYYAIPSPIDQLAEEGVPEFFEKISTEADGKEINEMLIVTFVKKIDISKTDFEKALTEVAEIYEISGFDVTQEAFEISNADIIYTFDNDIINAYYRRENPVAPDWLTAPEITK